MKFKKNMKKGFTLVELIVVIAIVAILAAVSVVSYLAFINSANESADIQLVKQLNTCLQADEALHGKKDWSEDYQGLRDLLEGNGFIVENLTKTKSGCDIVYQSKTNDETIINRYALLKGEDVIYSESTFASGNNHRNFWIPETAEEAQDLSEDGKGVVLGSEIGEVNLFEAHASVIVNGAIVNEIQYSNNDESQKVVICTNSFNTVVTVTAFESGTFGSNDYKCDSIRHFGDTKEVNIIKAGQASYHEFGNVGFTQVASGKFVAEAGSKTNTVVAISADAVIDSNGGEIEHKYATDASFGESNSKGNVELDVIAPNKVEEKKQEAIDAITPDPYAEIVAGGLAANASYAILKDDLTLYGYDMPLANVDINCVFVLLKDIKIDFSFNANSTITVDFNGHTWDLTGDGEDNSGLGLYNSNCILKDSKGNGKCIVPSINMMGNSTMIIESGFYELETVNGFGFGVNPLIKGGTFTNNPEEISGIEGNQNCVAPGYHAFNNGDGTWTVVAD